MSAVRSEFTHVIFETAAMPALWSNAFQGIALACKTESAAANLADGPPTFEIVASAALRDALALTTAEARLSDLIAYDRTLPLIAQTESVARETLRSPPNAIFAKNAASRQTELLGLVDAQQQNSSAASSTHVRLKNFRVARQAAAKRLRLRTQKEPTLTGNL